jgi:hypothetical protein
MKEQLIKAVVAKKIAAGCGKVCHNGGVAN